MATDITMPQMGFDMTEGTVANWLKKVGDPVKKGEAIAEVETDKTTIQVEAFAGGVLLAINTAAGQKVPVNTVIGVIGQVGEVAGAQKQEAPSKTQETPSPQPQNTDNASAIEMPQMGFDMTEGTVAQWLKREGEAVKKGEAIADIETDKTTIQVEAFASGTLLKIAVPAGQKVPVKTVIGYIGKAGAVIGAKAEDSRPAKAEQPQIPSPLPLAANSSADATPIAKRMAEENKIDLRQVKATGPEGRITKGDVEAYLALTHAPQAAKTAVVNGRAIASPYAKKLAAERGIDLTQISGSGPEGRIMADDVKAAQPAESRVHKTETLPQSPALGLQAQGSIPQIASGKKAFTRMRQTIAKRMTDSKTQVPHYYLTMQVEMDAALALRAQINDSLKAEGIKVSVNDLVVKASAAALRKFPNFNATFAGDGIELRDQVHLGIAVAMDGGLIVVTLRDADKKTLKQIGAEVPAIATRVREGKAQAGDLGGQTFTTSNLGMYGVETVLPIINQPDAGILGIGSATPTAIVRDGQIVVRQIMHLTLAGDHRVTDGAEGAQFIGEIKRLLENPWGLVL